ncbi:MAG TPA: VIT domain-containing protein, partial [Isosphaeraceae bacterium]
MPRSSRLVLALVAVGWALPARLAPAQGLIIDRRPNVPVAGAFEVREVAVEARIRDQVAEVQVAQTFHNSGSVQIEAEYLFPLPEDGAIQSFVLLVDGKELPGRLMKKEEARRIYEEIVRAKRDPALLEYMGRGLIRTSVFPIPPGADRKVTLRTTQLCRRDRDVVEFLYPFGTQKFTAKPIRKLALSARIESKDPIKSLYSPSHGATIQRSGDHAATVSLEQRDVVPTADFRLVYSLAEGTLGASVLSYRPSAGDDGYFLLLASPRVKTPDVKPQPKTVVFVLDRSGSMSGKKIEQARNALKFVLENLRDDDLFNIVVYDDRVETYKPELQRYSKDARAAAVEFVENIRPGGSTNIDGAVREALGLIRDDSRPNYVLFLTDGLPTAGSTDEATIARNAREANRKNARLFAFGVGFDVNARLIDRLSGGNGGTSEYVKPDEDIEAHVARFYAKLTSPVLASIAIDLAGTDVNRTYPRDVPDLFEGGQLVWVGRYRRSGDATVRLTGKVGTERQVFEFPTRLADPGEGSRYDFVEKLWAIRRVGFIIDQIDLHGANKELTDELVALSTQYGILTPYTSFLADERVGLGDRAANITRTRENLVQLGEVQGRSGVAQRDAKALYQRAERVADATSYSAAPAAEPAFGSTSGMMGRMGGYGAVGGGGLGGSAVQPLPRMPAGMTPAAPAAAAGQPAQSTFGPQAGRPLATATAFREELERRSLLRSNANATLALAKDVEGRDLAVGTVRQLGAKTFFRKNDRWVDAEVQAEDEAKAIVLEQFSDAFFTLARAQTAEANQYLTFDEPV